MEKHDRKFEGIWIAKEIWLNKELTLQEKVMIVEMNSLDNEEGCFASNKYFANFFGLTTQRISQIINSLEKKNYIKIEYIYENKEITKRIIRINKSKFQVLEVSNIFDRGYQENFQGYQENLMGYQEKFKDNNTSNNTYNNTNNKETIKESLKNDVCKEVIEYMNELAGTAFKHTTAKTKSLINARLNEGFDVEDMKDVVFFKYNTWFKEPIKFDNVSGL